MLLMPLGERMNLRTALLSPHLSESARVRLNCSGQLCTTKSNPLQQDCSVRLAVAQLRPTALSAQPTLASAAACAAGCSAVLPRQLCARIGACGICADSSAAPIRVPLPLRFLTHLTARLELQHGAVFECAAIGVGRRRRDLPPAVGHGADEGTHLRGRDQPVRPRLVLAQPAHVLHRATAAGTPVAPAAMSAFFSERA
eukprot:366083-Chlamydomonas_euryale.AAC.23